MAVFELTLPNQAPDKYASVIKLEIDGELQVAVQLPTPDSKGMLVLKADDAYIHNNEGSKQAEIRSGTGDVPNIGYWTDDQAWVEWNINIDQPGTYEVSGIVSVEGETTKFGFGIEGQSETTEIKSTGSYGNYESRSFGTISIDQTGALSFRVKPEAGQWNPMNLRQITLQRQAN